MPEMPGALSPCALRVRLRAAGWLPGDQGGGLGGGHSSGWPLTLCAVEARPSRSAFTFPVIGAAKGPIVAVACVDAVWAPVGGWTS